MALILSFPLTGGIIDSGLSIQSNGAEYLGSTTIPSASVPQGVAGHCVQRKCRCHDQQATKQQALDEIGHKNNSFFDLAITISK